MKVFASALSILSLMLGAQARAESRRPVALACSFETTQGIERRPIKITYVFADPESPNAPIERRRWEKDPFSGRESTSSMPMFAIDSYPRMDRSPDGKIEIMATRDGTTNFDIPELGRIHHLVISNRASAHPKLTVQFRYSGDRWLFDGPRSGFDCVKP